MMKAVSIVALLLVAVTMGLTLAHALELPGKLRLDKNTYVAVQAIYYPGFTIGGLVGELGGLLVLFALLFFDAVWNGTFLVDGGGLRVPRFGSCRLLVGDSPPLTISGSRT